MPRRPRSCTLKSRGNSSSCPTYKNAGYVARQHEEQELEYMLTSLNTNIPPRRVYGPRGKCSVLSPRPHIANIGQTTSDIAQDETLQNPKALFSIKFPSPATAQTTST